MGLVVAAMENPHQARMVKDLHCGLPSLVRKDSKKEKERERGRER